MVPFSEYVYKILNPVYILLQFPVDPLSFRPSMIQPNIFRDILTLPILTCPAILAGYLPDMACRMATMKPKYRKADCR